MKWLIAAVLASAAVVAPASAQTTPRPATEFAIHMPDGKDTLLSQYRGKVVVLALLNTGCSHCQGFAKRLSLFQQEYGAKGVQVLAAVFDQGAKQGLEKFRTLYVQGYPVGYSDEAAVMRWLQQPVEQGYFVPIVAFINRKGTIESQHLGDDNLFQDPDGNIRHKLEAMLKAK